MHLNITGQRQDRSAWLGEAVEANWGVRVSKKIQCLAVSHIKFFAGSNKLKIPITRPSVVVQVFNPSTREVEAVRDL